MPCGDDVAQNGWRTGSVLAEEMLPELAEHLKRPGEETVQINGDDWLVVISQTCDIVAAKLEAEPLVEVLHCQALSGDPRSGKRDLQSTRYLDFRPNRDTHPEVCLTAHALVNRYVIPRGILAKYEPDPHRCLSDNAAKRVLAWYALRAARPSWPNSFVNRISKVTNKLKDSLKILVDEIAEVRVAIREKDQELADSESYRLVVYFVVDEEVWGNDYDGRKKINEAFGNFIGNLKKCDGIEILDESDVLPGNAFTWQLTRLTDEWNFANLSCQEP